MPALILKRGRQESLLRRHPWIFSGAVERVVGSPEPGDTVDLVSSSGEWMAAAAYSPLSQICARTWSFAADEIIDADFFRRRLSAAVERRREIDSTAIRLVYSESDELPGLIVDRYDRYLVCQFLSAGAERYRAEIVAALDQIFSDIDGIYDRSDAAVRLKEGLESRTGVLSGKEPPETIAVQEGDLCYLVDIRSGHKTGFYLDQRANRTRIQPWCRDAAVLNCFSYTGAFGIAALAAGAEHVVQIDSSETALIGAKENTRINRLDLERCEFIAADVFQQLRRYRDGGDAFDVIILDPPKFADSQSQLKRAARGYKDINLLAIKLLRPGGRLVTFSCSGLLPADLFQKIIADAALDAGRPVQILERLHQDRDHPTLSSFPEAAYLKGLICRVLP